MGYNHSPRIITDGLVLVLDVANSKSYPGSGTTWNDLSGNGYVGTLTNGPTFSGDNLGSIVLDGVDDYIIVNPDTINTDSTTFEIWCKVDNPSSSGGSQIVFGYPNGTNQRVYFGFNTSQTWDLGIQTSAWSTTPLLVDTNWHYFVITLNIGIAKIYQDGNEYRTKSYTSFTTSGNNLRIGDNFNSSYSFAGKTSIFKIYNRVLTQDEITQNYNAIKSRYGL
jgi:hypothetical protein